MKQVGVVLSGCGVYDGTEIHEAVLTLLALDRAGAQAVCFAPDKPQLHVINHLSGDETGEQRNVLTESARIARGQVQPLSAARAEQLDALIVPGGFGAAKNLSSFATQGAECEVDDDLARLTREMHKANKPIGFMCIAPALLPKLLDQQVRLTIGNDPDLGEVIDTMGGEPVICPVDDIVVDGEHKVVTTPAYMLAQSIGEAASGIDKLVSRVLDLTE
ncbi:Sigma cross-reacting protein 27A [Serratia rubidaea]|uniref:Glyoxalase n=1 Tax=Serratia rubidaea TaxID=61652 RepID=A0A448SBE8_SERRU|nr:isoprenoid biosynthesis glyoxalase ElbB [Serratia rubidaea]AML56791.1 Sigma cross-reacting protein 27A [Serratia rubidaea]MBD8453829.1 isoprenoid biosynthesis glyoxalase ElbB [Serratia rubidaea]MBH1931308.1 isoprenoid biosynthesis glyoxalase ElbB [Serratia rubidaea]MCR0998856.1 isoprenoid biosynthesis glyoxalase ElbB [Serratia rubidaea]MDC6109113.1 isoprenoid biosynthesis glyoxalase ElbB [Serratia rubidaea]